MSTKTFVHESQNSWLPHPPFISNDSHVCLSFLGPLLFVSFSLSPPVLRHSRKSCWRSLACGSGQAASIGQKFPVPTGSHGGGEPLPIHRGRQWEKYSSRLLKFPHSTSSSNHMCRYMSLKAVDSAVSKGDAVNPSPVCLFMRWSKSSWADMLKTAGFFSIWFTCKFIETWMKIQLPQIKPHTAMHKNETDITITKMHTQHTMKHRKSTYPVPLWYESNLLYANNSTCG